MNSITFYIGQFVKEKDTKKDSEIFLDFLKVNVRSVLKKVTTCVLMEC